MSLSHQLTWAAINAYAAERADVFGGSYVSEAGEPRYMTLWTRDAQRHATMLTELTGKLVGGREVRWTCAHLDGEQGFAIG